MKKYILTLILIFGVTSISHAVDVCLTIPSGKLSKTETAMLAKFPMPQVNNANGTGTVGTGTILDRRDDFDDGSGTALVDQYTNLQWFRVLMARGVVSWISEYNQKNARATADTTVLTTTQNDISGIE